MQTWIIFGPSFRLPVAAEWDPTNTVAKVSLHPAIPWLKCWITAVGELLSAVAFSESDAWYVPSAALQTIAAPLEVEDIESVIQWSPEKEIYHLAVAAELSPMTDKKLAEAATRRAFLQSFVDAVGLAVFESLEELELFYLALTNYMMVHMLERNRVVPLGFVDLYASSLWPGWKYSLRNVMRDWRNAKRKNPEKMSAQERLWNYIYGLKMRKGDKETRTEVRLPQMIPTEAWWATVRLSELAHKQHLKEQHYVAWADNRFKAMLPVIARDYYRDGDRWHFEDFRGLFPHLRVRAKRVAVKRPYRHRGNTKGNPDALIRWRERQRQEKLAREQTQANVANPLANPFDGNSVSETRTVPAPVVEGVSVSGQDGVLPGEPGG